MDQELKDLVRRDIVSFEVVAADPNDIVAIDTVRTISGYEINVIPGSEKDIIAAVENNYSGSPDMETVRLGLVKVDGSTVELGAGVDATEVELRANDPPVVKFVNLLLLDAIERRASDIHMALLCTIAL